MKTIEIKTKHGTNEYVPVNERIKEFWRLHPGWSIETELLTNNNGVCVMKSTIKDDMGVVKSIGHAYEKESSTFINKTSYIENCETSAIGRALGIMGIGIDSSISSAEELENAIINQKMNEKIDETQINELILFAKEHGSETPEEHLKKKFRVTDLRNITQKQRADFYKYHEKHNTEQ